MADTLEGAWAADEPVMSSVSMALALEEASAALDKAQTKLSDLIASPRGGAASSFAPRSKAQPGKSDSEAAAAAAAAASATIPVKLEKGIAPEPPQKNRSTFNADVARVVAKRKHNSDMELQWRSTKRLAEELKEAISTTPRRGVEGGNLHEQSSCCI